MRSEVYLFFNMSLDVSSLYLRKYGTPNPWIEGEIELLVF